jgi:adenylate cyclase
MRPGENATWITVARSCLMAVSWKLVAVFAAEVEGYSRLTGADEVGTLKGLTERRAVLDRLIGEHRGRMANTAGDSVLAEFGSAVDAVQSAVRKVLSLKRTPASPFTGATVSALVSTSVT